MRVSFDLDDKVQVSFPSQRAKYNVTGPSLAIRQKHFVDLSAFASLSY
jgi:hypothetical protein